MIDIQDKKYCPTLGEMIEYVHNPVFARFCSDMKSKYHCSEKIEFSSCSWQFGWNIKFKKSGKTNVPYIQRKIILLFWLLSE